MGDASYSRFVRTIFTLVRPTIEPKSGYVSGAGVYHVELPGSLLENTVLLVCNLTVSSSSVKTLGNDFEIWASDT